MAALDVNKAFLKGVAYKELTEETKEPMREVNFELSRDAVDILRQVPGYQDFNPQAEILHCAKPGTGCVDAPRCFSIKLSRVDKMFGAAPTTHDSQFTVKHNEAKHLIFMAVKHVDDIKVVAMKEVILAFIKCLEQVFGGERST